MTTDTDAAAIAGGDRRAVEAAKKKASKATKKKAAAKKKPAAKNPGPKQPYLNDELAHPLDAVPSLERKRGIISDDWYGRGVPKADRTGRLYVSHFATCPQAGRWRR